MNNDQYEQLKSLISQFGPNEVLFTISEILSKESECVQNDNNEGIEAHRLKQGSKIVDMAAIGLRNIGL